MSPTEERRPPRNAIDATELDRVVDAFLAERQAGRGPTTEELIGAHPELMPQLGEVLQRLKLMDQARELDNQPANLNTLDMVHYAATTAASVKCPRCRYVATLLSSSVGNVTCDQCEFEFVVTSQLMAPVQTIDRFELVECVGVGGFGTVWRATDRHLDRIVAIKLPRQQPTGREREDFLNEARIAAQLKHRHIVDVYEIGTVEDTIYIVSDFIDGVSLDVWSKQNRLSAPEVATLACKLCDAVEVAHQAGIVHRDLKPGNVLMDLNGEPTITDFGLAKQLATDVTVTLDGRILGTPAYMSPEQAAGRSARADTRSDVYSLGVMLYELLTGERPFRGQTSMLIHQVIHDDPVPPRHLDASVPADLETITLKCLEKKPEARFESAGEVADELRRFLAGEPIASRPLSPFARVVRWSQRKPAVALTVATILVLFATGWWSYYDERQDRLSLAEAMEQEHLMRQALLQTGDFQQYEQAVEAVADDPELIAMARQIRADSSLAESIDAYLAADAARALTPEEVADAQDKVATHPTVKRLQVWLEQHHRSTADEMRVFSWFVLDYRGTQVARSPQDRAVGRNYAWRTYFHGGPRDYEGLADYQKRAPSDQRLLSETHLSRGFFTEITKRYVVVVSTPIRDASGEFQGVLGVMVELSDL